MQKETANVRKQQYARLRDVSSIRSFLCKTFLGVLACFLQLVRQFHGIPPEDVRLTRGWVRSL